MYPYGNLGGTLTTAWAALFLDRKAIAFDVDAAVLKIAEGRLLAEVNFIFLLLLLLFFVTLSYRHKLSPRKPDNPWDRSSGI